MKTFGLNYSRVSALLRNAAKVRVLVVGDLMLDQFLWGNVSRISPEAPVPVVVFERESFMPGGAANVARNLADLGSQVDLYGVVGRDQNGKQLLRLLEEQRIGHEGIVALSQRPTSVKTRIIAHQQQVVRLDRESKDGVPERVHAQLANSLEEMIPGVDAVIIADYGKGVVTQTLLDRIKTVCRANGTWLSLDPKPVHRLRLSRLSLITPNRKEAFELARLPDERRAAENPLEDVALRHVYEKLLAELEPAVLLITLGEKGMLLAQQGEKPIHIPTVAREVFDVSGAGDTVIGSFTLAIACGASPLEAAIISNHAGGVVVGKVGTATVTPRELLDSFKGE